MPWLGDAETRLAQLPDTVFSKKEVEKQVRLLQQIRNDIWKRYVVCGIIGIDLEDGKKCGSLSSPTPKNIFKEPIFST